MVERDGVDARGDGLHAVVDDGLRHDGGGGGAVARLAVGLGGHLLHQAHAHVHLGVLQRDLAGDGHAVVHDLGGAVVALQHHVAALGAQRHLHGVGHLVDALNQLLARVLFERDAFGVQGRVSLSERVVVAVAGHEGRGRGQQQR